MLLIQVHRGNYLRIALKHDYTSFTEHSSRGLVCAAVFMSLCHFIVVFIWYSFDFNVLGTLSD